MKVALFALVLGAYAYFYQGGGWNQNSRFDLTRPIVEQHTSQIDAYVKNAGIGGNVKIHRVLRTLDPALAAPAAGYSS